VRCHPRCETAPRRLLDWTAYRAWLYRCLAAGGIRFRYRIGPRRFRSDRGPRHACGRTGQSTKGATHLIKVAVEAALGLRPKIDVFGTDYPTPDGTCIRDYIHVSDLATAHLHALAYLRRGGASTTLNCGYGRGFSVLEVIDVVKRVCGVDFKVEFTGRRAGDPAQIVAACDRIRSTLNWQPHFNDLRTIVSHARAWERKLSQCAK
jgi:UDP-glucose 4-epimerase